MKMSIGQEKKDTLSSSCRKIAYLEVETNVTVLKTAVSVGITKFVKTVGKCSLFS